MDYKAILAGMTLEEKLAQLTQTTTDHLMPDGQTVLMGNAYADETDNQLLWNVGSTLGVTGAENALHAQQEYMKHNPHGIPLLMCYDVIHGWRTIFPIPLGLACSWEPELFRVSCEIAAREASAAGLHLTFAPMCDLARDARWGRVMESTGEDPWLNSLYAAQSVRGFQGDDPASPGHIATCVKHFAGYGAAEGGRDYDATEISPRALHDQYLPAYRAAIEAGSPMVMTAFNALNGTPCTGNTWLLGELLRGQWGFDGTVISDCTAVYELIPHGYAEDMAQAAERALTAGVDIEMVSTGVFDHGRQLLAEGRITMEQIDAAVLRVLELKDRLGLFDRPCREADPQLEQQLCLCSAHREAALHAAVRSCVLLRNDGALPLQSGRKLALGGPWADRCKLLDVWSCLGRDEECVSMYEGLREVFDVTLLPAQGTEEAVRAAEDCDTVVLVLGDGAGACGEAHSRARISLPEEQRELLRAMKQAGKTVIVVLLTGRPMAIGEDEQWADAILCAWIPGTEAGHAVAQLLSGASEPVGRLTMTFPWSEGQCPVYYNALPSGRPQPDDEEYQPFRCGYTDLPACGQYPFGYGLGYTSFEVSDITLSSDTLTGASPLTAAVRVTNTGKREGETVIQLYLRDMAGAYARPRKELKDFRRISLAPGESTEIVFRISADQLRYTMPDGRFSCEGGMHCVMIGENSRQVHTAAFRYDGTEEAHHA